MYEQMIKSFAKRDIKATSGRTTGCMASFIVSSFVVDAEVGRTCAGAGAGADGGTMVEIGGGTEGGGGGGDSKVTMLDLLAAPGGGGGGVVGATTLARRGGAGGGAGGGTAGGVEA